MGYKYVPGGVRVPGLPVHAQWMAFLWDAPQISGKLRPLLAHARVAVPPLGSLPGSPPTPSGERRYAYAITVRLPGGKEQPCLIPFVGLMNHDGGAPHCVHFSRVDEATRTLR